MFLLCTQLRRVNITPHNTFVCKVGTGHSSIFSACLPFNHIIQYQYETMLNDLRDIKH